MSKQVEGIHNMMSRLLLKRDNSDMSETSMKHLANYVHPLECPLCHGKRLNSAALSCKVAGYSQCHLLNENSDIMSEFFFSTSNPNFLIIT